MKYTRQKLQKTVFILSFTLIPVALMLVFTYYPALKLVYYSFTNYKGTSPVFDYVGLFNWKLLLRGGEVWSALFNSVYYIIGGIVQNALALLLAVVLNDLSFRGRNLFRGIVFMPFILNGTAVSYMFRYFFDYSKGPLNMVITALGFQPVSWLSNPAIVNWALAFICLWKYTGYLMVLYLAGLQAISADLYEAAMLDGAGKWQQFRFITWPSIINVIKLQMFLNISGAINIFDIPFVITDGGPVGASMTLALQANNYAFEYHNFGLASTFGIFCTLAVVVVYLLQDKLLYRKEGK